MKLDYVNQIDSFKLDLSVMFWPFITFPTYFQKWLEMIVSLPAKLIPSIRYINKTVFDTTNALLLPVYARGPPQPSWPLGFILKSHLLAPPALEPQNLRTGESVHSPVGPLCCHMCQCPPSPQSSLTIHHKCSLTAPTLPGMGSSPPQSVLCPPRVLYSSLVASVTDRYHSLVA